ncbi:MAG TPA: hypothetical protein DCK93_17830 [Blastocatellia bacterium]|nr:hypothetical protein [Blastocatellia bacterium]HAF24734.1 hypothetical protein [Blastocatellia bacterium]
MLYGAAEFSRDTDFAILASQANLSRLRAALAELQAEVIAVPPFELNYLRKGHAIHFRCHASEAAGMRVDVMTKMRGVDTFAKLWPRRSTLLAEDGTSYELMSLRDLVKAKKTQRDKDWPMIRRLVEADYFKHRAEPKPQHLRFWFLELRTPELLIELAAAHPEICRKLIKQRSLLKLAPPGEAIDLMEALSEEERLEREADREYWVPLKAELEQLRRARLRDG